MKRINRFFWWCAGANINILEKCPKLKLICITATGQDNVDLDYCLESGITVKNAKGYSTESVAQHTFTMAFYLIGKSAYFSQYTQGGKWEDSEIFSHHGRSFNEINGKTWGIIGLGTIGRKVAKIARAFGANVIYFSTSGKNIDQEEEQVDLDTLLLESDIISIHAPLNERTHNLIARKELEKLKHLKQ